jgi:hypothetical protein
MAEILGRSNSRLRQHFQRWGRRWPSLAADSFSRISEDGLGIAETGHTWRRVCGTVANNSFWALIGGKAGLWIAGLNENFWADLWVGTDNVRVEVRITIGTVTAPGVGIAFRTNSAGTTGVGFTYAGGTEYRFISWTGNTNSTLKSQTGGPTLTLGNAYQFKLTAVGSAINGSVDGVPVISHTSSSGLGNFRHGLFLRDNSNHRFDNLRIYRA